MKTTWRLTPAIAQNARSGRRKGCWILNEVTKASSGTEMLRSHGAFDTIKAARDMVNHLKRKPIELG